MSRQRPPRRLPGAALALAVLAAGAGGVALQLLLPARLPSALDWQAAAALLARDARPGDALLSSPAWAERLRLGAPAQLRVLTRLSPADLQGVRRVWLVSLPGAPRFSRGPELELLARSASPDPALAVGRLQIGRHELAHPDLPLAALTERLATAAVTLGGKPCEPAGAGFRCGAERSSATLEGGVLEVNGLPRSCLVARSAGHAASLRITFPDVPVGRVLRGHAGLVQGGAEASAPLTVAVRVQDEEAAAVQLDAAGWPDFRVDTTRWAGQHQPVALEVVVPEGRDLCLQAETLP